MKVVFDSKTAKDLNISFVDRIISEEQFNAKVYALDCDIDKEDSKELSQFLIKFNVFYNKDLDQYIYSSGNIRMENEKTFDEYGFKNLNEYLNEDDLFSIIKEKYGNERFSNIELCEAIVEWTKRGGFEVESFYKNYTSYFFFKVDVIIENVEDSIVHDSYNGDYVITEFKCGLFHIYDDYHDDDFITDDKSGYF